MDIQKEREAFEEFYKSNFSEMDLSHANQLRCINGRYLLDRARWLWGSWQAAKASAVPDGFVLVPKECSDEMAEVIAATARVCGGIAGDVYDAIVKQAMVEAAEHGE